MLAGGQPVCWEVKVFDNNLAGNNATDLLFDFVSASEASTRYPFGRGCFAPRQSVSFHGDLELAWSAGPPAGYALRGNCSAGPMGASAFLLVGLDRLASPHPIFPTGCPLLLDPAWIVALGPWKLDHIGNLSLGATAPVAFLPADPSLSGTNLYGQWAALTPSGFQVLMYTSNGIQAQLPWLWGQGRGPGVSTIFATGAGSHTAQSGTLLLHEGLVVTFGT